MLIVYWLLRNITQKPLSWEFRVQIKDEGKENRSHVSINNHEQWMDQ